MAEGGAPAAGDHGDALDALQARLQPLALPVQAQHRRHQGLARLVDGEGAADAEGLGHAWPPQALHSTHNSPQHWKGCDGGAAVASGVSVGMRFSGVMLSMPWQPGPLCHTTQLEPKISWLACLHERCRTCSAVYVQHYVRSPRHAKTWPPFALHSQ